MPRVPVRQIGTTIRPGWGLKVGTRITVGQPFRLIGRVSRERRGV